jgi:hypothetical protein
LIVDTVQMNGIKQKDAVHFAFIRAQDVSVYNFAFSVARLSDALSNLQA